MSFQSILQNAEELSQQFSQRTSRFEDEQHFPFKNFEELKAKDFHALTIPKQYGGHGLNLHEFLSIQK
jgi:alkylation response protein AidB-like acyl-CoA dehydrogenase